MSVLPLSIVRMTHRLTDRLATDDPVFTRLALLIALALLPIAATMTIDLRTTGATSIWLKPAKFHIALAIYLITLGFFARWLSPSLTARRGFRFYQGVVSSAVIAELVWIGGAAAVGTSSHFNTATELATAIYRAMGGAAVVLTSAALVYGVAILRTPANGLPAALRLGIGGGLVLTFVLTVITVGTMAVTSGHLIGTPVDPDNAVWLMGWSREVGDLRVAHFLSTHAMHAVPLAALLAHRWLAPGPALRVVWLACAIWPALVAATFAQALAGQPTFG